MTIPPSISGASRCLRAALLFERRVGGIAVAQLLGALHRGLQALPETRDSRDEKGKALVTRSDALVPSSFLFLGT